MRRKAHRVALRTAALVLALAAASGVQVQAGFPAIRDWRSLKITLERWGCYGDCPVYKVEIDGDGTVIYRGALNVVVTGAHRTRISQDAVRALFERFQRADFFALWDKYASGSGHDPPGIVTAVTQDAPSYIVGIAFDGRAKTVEDTLGAEHGIPHDVVQLESAIDDVAVTSSWVEGDSQTVDKLRAEGWDLRLPSDRHSRLLAAAAENGNTALARQLLDAGLSARSPFGCAALSVAAERNYPDLVDVLVAAGAPAHGPEIEVPDDFGYPRCIPLAAAATGGNPRIVDRILSLHPDIDARDVAGRTALMNAAENGSQIRDGVDRIAVLHRLLAAGADVNARDDKNQSALMTLNGDAPMVRVLLKAGAADVNTPDWHGRTPLIRSYDAGVTQALLEAGADPYLKDMDGKTALDYADRWNKTGPVLERWMAAHPRK